jgi:hypothetical protein
MDGSNTNKRESDKKDVGTTGDKPIQKGNNSGCLIALSVCLFVFGSIAAMSISKSIHGDNKPIAYKIGQWSVPVFCWIAGIYLFFRGGGKIK